MIRSEALVSIVAPGHLGSRRPGDGAAERRRQRLAAEADPEDRHRRGVGGGEELDLLARSSGVDTSSAECSDPRLTIASASAWLRPALQARRERPHRGRARGPAPTRRASRRARPPGARGSGSARPAAIRPDRARSTRSPAARPDGPARRSGCPRSSRPRPSRRSPDRTRCACRPATGPLRWSR